MSKKPLSKRFPSLINTQMVDDVTKIIDDTATPNYVNIIANIKSSTDPDLNIIPWTFTNLDISQDFDNTYIDFINVEFRLTPIDYMRIMRNPEKLICTLKYYHYDIQLKKQLKEIGSKSYLMIIKDKNDLLKKFPYRSIVSSNDDAPYDEQLGELIPVVAQLIPAEEYAMRKIKVNVIYRDVTVKDVIIALAKEFNIRKLWMVEPDNKKKYTNFIIPPMIGIDEIFTYLQEDSGKGVYYKGLNYYITDNTLYVYPKWTTEILCKQFVHLYKVPETELVGLKVYHKVDKGTMRIIINAETLDKFFVDEAIENVGTTLLAMHCENVVDKWRDPNEGDMYTIHSDNMTQEDMDDVASGMVKKPYQPIYVESEENIFSKTEWLSIGNASILQTTWLHAVPFTFKPGWPVIYHYIGENNNYRVIVGTCVDVIYSYQMMEGLKDNVFAIVAKFTLRLPAYTIDENKKLTEKNDHYLHLESL